MAIDDLPGVVELSAAPTHTCARLDEPRCWGRNASGQLGDRTTDPRLTPVPVLGL